MACLALEIAKFFIITEIVIQIEKMVKGAKVVKGNERVLEAPVAMEVVEDTTNKEPLEIPSEIEKLHSLIDKTLTELHSNVEIEANMEILQRISSAITEGTLGDSEKEQLY